MRVRGEGGKEWAGSMWTCDDMLLVVPLLGFDGSQVLFARMSHSFLLVCPELSACAN